MSNTRAYATVFPQPGVQKIFVQALNVAQPCTVKIRKEAALDVA